MAKKNPDQLLLDEITAHNMTMRILDISTEMPSDGSAELAGCFMATAILARFCDGNRNNEYRQRKNFLKTAGEVFDRSIAFMRDVEANRQKAQAGEPTDPVVQQVLDPRITMNTFAGKETDENDEN